MISSTESKTSLSERVDYVSSRLILMSLNIHVELNDGRFALSHSNEIRKHSDNSLISSSTSNTFIDELLTCIEYYCEQIDTLADALRSIVHSSSESTRAIQMIDDLSKGSALCLDVICNYHRDRSEAMHAILASPFREDAWSYVYEIDWSVFGKCRIILIRLRIYFLLMHQILTDTIEVQTRSSSSHSLVNHRKRSASNKRRKVVDFQV